MRIAVVSAHYPPDFVSGGTLVPQRIAEGLADRGHDVLVYAGSTDRSRPDLSVRTDHVGDRLTVRWITIAGMLAWDDDANFANDAVAADFAGWVARTRPDVVHFHNLQGLGGALVSIARATGAATVVTMHDAWWWCARQFLVEPSLRPCATVVDCGVCGCERDDDWLVARNRRLAGHLGNADLVLAPSSAMVELLAANGVDPRRLALDENAAPASVRRPPERTPGRAGVRFVFAGGGHPVKGAGVAAAAARRLADLPGWTLDMHGVADTTEVDLRDLPPQVRLLGPYRAADAPQVLAAADVLVLSSIMLESYSLLTREALAAGCVVVTSDTPGPTEVVRDGGNGLVVPRGDPVALAAAMRRLVEDPDLLRRLRPTPGAVQLRPVERQLDDLLTAYDRIRRARAGEVGAGATGPSAGPAGVPTVTTTAVTTTAVTTSTTPIDVRRVVILSGITGAPLRYRGWFAQEALRTVGVQAQVHMYRDAAVPAAVREADAVVLYRVPATDQLRDLLQAVRERPEPVPVVADVDDLVFDPGVRAELQPVLDKLPDFDHELYWQGVRRYRTTLEWADAFIGSTQVLCEQATALVGLPSHRWANGVGRQVARASDAALRRDRARGPLRIGYLSGTNTHNDDWAFVEGALCEVLRRRPEVQLWIGGLLEPSPAVGEFGGRVRRLPLQSWRRLPGVLRDLDVNLAPLEPGKTFNEAKSAIKWLEAALTATPTVASPTQPFREVVEHGRTGLLAADPDAWVEHVLAMVDDRDARDRMGQAARQQALLTLSPARQGHRYLEVLRTVQLQVARDGHRPPSATWVPETLSEPYVRQIPDDYGRVAAPRPRRGSTLRRLVREQLLERVPTGAR